MSGRGQDLMEINGDSFEVEEAEDGAGGKYTPCTMQNLWGMMLESLFSCRQKKKLQCP